VLRTVVYSHQFEQHILSVFGSAEAADERLRAVEWALIRETDFSYYPRIQQLTNGETIYVFRTDATESSPSLIVLFSISADNQVVTFYRLRVEAVALSRTASGG
jgi:uncharacterized Rossmann fold enzyme